MEKFKPEEGQEYWFVNERGMIQLSQYTTDTRSNIHEARIAYGNCFKREREAKFAEVQIFRLLQTLHEPQKQIRSDIDYQYMWEQLKQMVKAADNLDLLESMEMLEFDSDGFKTAQKLIEKEGTKK